MTLKATDRCDTGKCGAQAYVSVMLLGGELLFCAHHYRDAAVKLTSLGAVVVQETVPA